MNEMLKKISKIVLVFSCNFVLYVFAVSLSLPLSRLLPYPSIVLYLMVGGASFFWTYHVLLTTIPSAIAYPLTLAIFASAVIYDDTGGKSHPSLWSSAMDMMNRDQIELLILSVMAATTGWLLFSLRWQKYAKGWQNIARLCFILLSILLIPAYMLFVF